MEKQVKAPPMCETHGIQKIRRFNSTIAVCPNCEREKQKQRSQDRIKHNNALLRQSHQRNHETANAGSKKAKKQKFSLYRTTAWKWFSRYVLLLYSYDDGITFCCTSGRPLQINKANCHCGHYVKVLDGNSSNYATAFDLVNVGPQSSKDNSFMGGRQNIMREWLVKRHGEKAVQEMEQRSKLPFHLDDLFLEKTALEYKARFYKLLKQRNMKDPWKK